MSFLAPAAFALATLIPIIIAMYLLRLRRTEQLVSSVYLWRRMVRDLEANAPWQRLRRNLLLILQLLFLAALVLALTRPFTWAAGASSQSAIVILDTSASMAAIDAPPDRLGTAKAMARQLVDGLPDDARITVIAAGEGAQVLIASSQDRREVYRVIDDLRVGAGGSNLTAAIELASAIAARQPDTEIIVLSDGRATLPERLAIKGRVRYLPIGDSGDNQAISLLSLQPPASGGSPVAFAQITNYSDSPAQRRLALYADGQLVNAYDLEIAPGSQRAVIADDLPPGTRLLEGQLTGQDVLPLDDRAWAIQGDTQPTAITLVTEGNRFLETALALLPGLQLSVVRPADFEQGQETGRLENDEAGSPAFQPSSLPTPPSPDLTILDAYLPITATLPAGNLFFIAPVRSTPFFSVTGTIDQPELRPVAAASGSDVDPLLSYVNFSQVSVLEAARVPLPEWARPVVMGDVPGESAPLLFVGEIGQRRIAVLAFDLHNSDLPLQVAFPLLLANLTGWLAPGSEGGLPTQVAPGLAVTLSLPPSVDMAQVSRPDGSTLRLMLEGGQGVFADTTQLGVYQVTWQPTTGLQDTVSEQHFAVNLFSPQESDVQPAETLPVAGDDAAAEGERLLQARREWWRPLGFVALALLMVEWLVYQRASLARLWRETRQIVSSGGAGR